MFGDTAHAATVGWLSFGVWLSVISGSQLALLQGLSRIGDLARVGILGAFVYRLAELPLPLPPRHLMGAAQTKRRLREALRGLLHEDVRVRWNKQGFRPPQETWFQGPLLAMAEDLLHSRSFCESGYWDAPWWHQALDRLKRGEAQLGWTL